MAPLFWHMSDVVFEYGAISAILICLLLAMAYVGSLYVWTKGSMGRDHPGTIKQRFLRVSIVCSLVVPVLWLLSTSSHQNLKARPLLTWIGLRLGGFLFAAVLPLFLTMVLFLGPLTLHYLDGIFKIYMDRHYWVANFKNLMWLRNHVVAPLTEEFMFRACMLPLLVPSTGEGWAVFLCPLFFGVAHFHHMIEKVKDGIPFQEAALQCLFQFGYTTVFGAYSAFLFLRTGHLVAPVIAHAFCNHMGFPNFQEVVAYKTPTRYRIMTMFVLGLVSWYFLLYPLTDPGLYGNDLYFV